MRDHKIRRFSAGDVLDQRGEISDRLNEALFRDLITGTLGGSLNMRNVKANTPRHRDAFAHVPTLIYAHLKFGEVFRVSANMTELITHAAALLDDTDQWHANLLPTEAGFVRFDKPLVVVDARNNEMLIHALTWGPAKLVGSNRDATYDDDIAEATFVSMWNDLDVQPDHYGTEMLRTHGAKLRKIAGRWSFIGGEVLVNGTRVGPALIEPSALGVRDEAISTPFTNNHRLMLAMCMLMEQTIVTKSGEKPNVHARRRAKQRKMSQSDITVVTLRRSYQGSDNSRGTSGTSREWHHRWVVRGHWRWAKVGPGRQTVRRVWVAGHVKGPEDKPLRVTKKVYDLKR